MLGSLRFRPQYKYNTKLECKFALCYYTWQYFRKLARRMSLSETVSLVRPYQNHGMHITASHICQSAGFD